MISVPSLAHICFLIKRRGLIFGIWAANASVGNILGALMVASVLRYGYQVNYKLLKSKKVKLKDF